MKSLVDKRISLLFRRKYTKDGIIFEDIFTEKVGKKSTFDYMIERTLMRPRDIIAFINECIENSDGFEQISMRSVKISENLYSAKRRDALVQEWRSVYFNIVLVINYICSKRKRHLSVSEIFDDPKLDDLALNILGVEDDKNDPLYVSALAFSENDGNRENFVRTMIASLYRIAAIGFRAKEDAFHAYAHINSPIIETSVIFSDSKIRIHPMLYGAYRLNES